MSTVLLQLLERHRSDIYELCLVKLREVMGRTDPSGKMELGFVAIYGEVTQAISDNLSGDPSRRDPHQLQTRVSSEQGAHDAHDAGYTVGQLVGAYGAICQGITKYAHHSEAPMTAQEFSVINLTLDLAVAQAVTEYQQVVRGHAMESEKNRLGRLVHDLRNSLAGAMLAHDLIKMGDVGVAGATSRVLTEAHVRMKDLIDRSVAQIRLGDIQVFDQTDVSVLGLLSEVESTLIPEAYARSIHVFVEADPKLRVFADRHLMTSAVANLAQNAVKFTKLGSRVWIRAFADGEEVVIEIEDECGGIPEGTIKTLFEPYVQVDANKSGLGLGLGIARQAAELNGGTVTVKSKPGIGCTFTLRLPIPGSPPTQGPKKSEVSVLTENPSSD